jgi:CheY-like chemotaxis protein/nitrogen-specific signal transduction histidine kinase
MAIWPLVRGMAKVRRKPSATRRTRRPKVGRTRAPRLSKRAIETTLAELAHEIRTPLTGILALGELLATAGLPPREREWAMAIKSTGEHLTMLTSLIVDAVRADTKGLVLRRDLIRPPAFAQSLAASFDARAQSKNIACEIAIAADLPEVVIGDAMRLRAALENLIDNAVKFTEYGSVRLDVASEKAARDRVRLLFTVTDSGIGLSAADIKQLFQPFAQANRSIGRRYGGAGLGLSYVKRIAQAMGGDLAVTSKPGSGSRFEFSALVTKVKAAGMSAVDRDSGGAASRSLAVLCVEDNPYGRIVLNTILSELGHRADFVGSGEAAVDAVANGRYDAVLMDVTLPGIDGFEATRRIRALPRPAGAVRIVGVSGRVNAADEATGRAAGMDAYLAKPLSPSGLAAALPERTS